MDYCGVRLKGGERVAARGEVEEAEGEMGIVTNLEENLGNLGRGEAVGEEREESGPTRLGAVVGKY